MTRKQYLGLVFCTLVGGMFGGLAAGWLSAPGVAMAAESSPTGGHGRCVGIAVREDGSRAYRIFEDGYVEGRRTTVAEDWKPLPDPNVQR